MALQRQKFVGVAVVAKKRQLPDGVLFLPLVLLRALLVRGMRMALRPRGVT